MLHRYKGECKVLHDDDAEGNGMVNTQDDDAKDDDAENDGVSGFDGEAGDDGEMEVVDLDEDSQGEVGNVEGDSQQNGETNGVEKTVSQTGDRAKLSDLIVMDELPEPSKDNDSVSARRATRGAKEREMPVNQTRKGRVSGSTVSGNAATPQAAVEDLVFFRQKKPAKIKPITTTDMKELRYEDMDEKTKQKYQRAAQEAFDEFLHRPNTTVIDSTLRRFIRENQEFMPSAASKSRKLAIQLLTNNRTNVMCVYHHLHDRDGAGQDGTGKYTLNGMPNPRHINQAKADGIEPEPGFLHCGCTEENALFDFFFWKTWQLSGQEDDGTVITESLRDQMLTPRLRAFFVQEFKAWTGILVDDLYQNKMSKKQYRIKLYEKQVNYFIKRLNRLVKEDGEKYYFTVEELK
ncbi:hypothetical protein H0H92_008650 [Tricholoma furcatifolium]|nr:hypothetical protein H0H92_008650 [Tricholoma furcatifolium]